MGRDDIWVQVDLGSNVEVGVECNECTRAEGVTVQVELETSGEICMCIVADGHHTDGRAASSALKDNNANKRTVGMRSFQGLCCAKLRHWHT